MATADFNAIWDGAIAYFLTLDVKVGVEAMATRRGDTLYTAGSPAYSPVWTLGRGVLDVKTDMAPVAKLDILDWAHQRPRDSADNYAQYWWMQGIIAMAALGVTREVAERRVQDANAFFVNSWLGGGCKLPSGAFTGIQGLGDAGIGFVTSWLTGAGWTTSPRAGGFVSTAQLILTMECKVTLPRT